MDGILRRVLGEDVALDLLLDPNLGWVKVDRGQLQQIVLNLAGNARDAMPQGGAAYGLKPAINITVKRGAPKPRTFLKLGEYVALIVRDTGQGMDAVTRARIFEPFFTTKEKGKGTGLGLATVYGIVKQSGGYIWVEAGEGRGSVFHTHFCRASISLPVPLCCRKCSTSNPMAKRSCWSRTIPRSGKMAAEGLRAAGYRALVAASARDALHLATEGSNLVDLLLTDVVMSGMTGPELADQFAAHFPRTPVLYMSGYTDDALGNHGLRGRTRHVLQKPFTHEMLIRRVHEVLERRRKR